jgi:Fe-S-cluster containining protein
MKGVDPSNHTKGIYFECQGCGRCCRNRGKYSYVYVSLPERKRLAQYLQLSTRAFTMRYCDKTDGFFHLRNPEKDCLFQKGNRCRVYGARPEQCRTWPFWPENMSGKVWFREIVEICPGIGKGPLWNVKQIEKQLRKEVERVNKH